MRPGATAGPLTRLILCCALCRVPLTAAAGADWGFSWDGEAYGYLTGMDLRHDSLINPGNRLARLPDTQATAELRLNLRAQREDWQLMLRPILLAQAERGDGDDRQHRDGYLSQGLIRFQATQDLGLSAGREVLNWGPAQLVSLSSPFYFDNGRNQPLRELSGVDNARLVWAPDQGQSLTLAWVTGSGHDREDIWHDTWLLKAERRAEDWSGGLVLSKTPGQGLFAGLYGQYTVSDAVLLYLEASSSTLADALVSPADTALPFRVERSSARDTDVLLGAAYTFENGQSVNLEYLHQGHGYDSAEEDAYFARAEASPLWAALALGQAPDLLGRDYLHLVWQGNPLEDSGYWRLMATYGLTDQGAKLSAYVERRLTDSVTALAMGELALGDERQEPARLYQSTLTLGLKVALP